MEDKREYSEIEIETAKNLIAKGYEWIARDEDDALFAYDGKPKKLESCWRSCGGEWQEFASSVPIFPQIKWDDEEPVRLRDIVPQVLTDEEREWLRTVVKPFPGKLKTVEVHNGAFFGRYVTFTAAYPTEWGGSSYVGKMRLLVTEDWFEGMKDYKKYAPEELGI